MGGSKESWWKKPIFCVIKKIKHNVKPVHWDGQSQLRYQDKYDFFKITQVFDEKQDSVTGNTVEQSVYGWK